jgi:hypothetical protein
MKTTRGPIAPTLAGRDSTTRAESDCPIMARTQIDLDFDGEDSQNYVVRRVMRAVDEGQIDMPEATRIVEEHAALCRRLGEL